RWTRILPAAFITYSLAYLDRSNYGLGAAAGMATELHISQQQSALLGAMFFLGYTLLQIPGTAYASKHSARRLIFVALVAWGTFSALTGVIRDFPLLAANRFLLGAAESFVFPSMLVLLTRWFTRSERSRATALLMLGNPVTVLWMSAVTGFLIHAWGWQMAFVIEGLVCVVWAFVWLLVMNDHPHQASWMGEESREALRQELDREQQRLPGVPNLRTAFGFKNVRWLCVQYFFWSLGVYGFVLWLPVVITKGSGLEIRWTGLLASVPYLFAAIAMVVVAHASDRAKQRKPYVWPLLMLSGVALAGSCLLAPHSFLWTYVFVVVAGAAMYAPYGPFFAIIPEMLPRNVAGEVMALVNTCGALGGFAGAYFVGMLQGYTGGPQAGFLLMSLSLIVSGIILAGMRTSSQESHA
ncbi:MAG TPA: MFS transporter, partial [Terracidiphilus sp.]